MNIQKACALLASFMMLSSSAQAGMIDFESDRSGPRRNNFSSVSDANLRFTDTVGADLYLEDFLAQSIGRGLAVLGDDDSRLLITFRRPADSLQLIFGNDEPEVTTPGDRAWLELFNGITSVGLVSVTMNRDDRANQLISASAAAFDSAVFWYGDSTGTAIDLIEVVDNIVYTDAAAPVPEPGSLALFALGCAGLAALRRRGISTPL